MLTPLASLPNEYSATIRLELLVDGRSIQLSQIAPEFVIFSQPTELPPCTGVVLMHVDEAERRWKVELPIGATPASRLTATIPAI